MHELLTHPGYVDYSDFNSRAGVEKKRRTRTFDSYRSFLHTEGVSKAIGDDVEIFLRNFFGLTKDLWEPRSCTFIPSRLSDANKALNSVPRLHEIYKLVGRRYLRWHFWLQIQNPNQTILIIDPCGVPQDPQNRQLTELIIPRFGLIDNAHDFAKEVYRQGEELDDWGTRDLPPGFHP